MEHEPPTRALNLAQLLRIPFQALVAELHERLAAAGYGDIRPTHTIVFAHVTAEGIRLTELAERAQLPKQLINYLVSAVEERGYVERVPDPVDRRGKLVRLTARGVQAAQAGRAIIHSVEEEWSGMLQEGHMHELRGRLEELVGGLGQRG